MAESADPFKDLDTRRWDHLEDLASRLEEAWKAGAPVALAANLPPPDDPLRKVALVELIKVDMECRWRHGKAVGLDHYLDKFDELRPKRTLAAELIYEEYRLPHRFGDKPALSLSQ